MTDYNWTEWELNPFTAARTIAEAYDCIDELEAEILRSQFWDNFSYDSFLDDLFTEIGGNVGIVIQYDTTLEQYRAAWDGRLVGTPKGQP